MSTSWDEDCSGTAKAKERAGTEQSGQGRGVHFPPSPPPPPGRFHSYFTNQKQKVNGTGLTTYFPAALGDQLSASRLTHTLFIQSFKYPIVSVFSTLIFSILMIRSPALALLGLATERGVFFFIPPPPSF